MSDMNDLNESNEIWNKEQAPFAGAASNEPPPGAGADPHSTWAAGSSTASAGASGAGGIPPLGGWAQASGGYAGPPPPPAVVSSSEPKPVLAGFLGLIPGVGAMYNGQFAKGIVHVLVFAIIVFFANNVNDIFGIFVAAWILFMAFEAYHTAKARRDGLPLPNAFGWNDIGERMGLGKNWPFSPGAPVASPAAGPAAPGGANAAGWTAGSQYPGAGVYTAPPSYTVSPIQPIPPVPPMGAAGYGVAPNWAGYVPPSAFASAPPAGSPVGGGAVPPGHGVPYVPVNAGAPYAPVPPVDLPAARSRLPVGAIWLIVLGVLFLLGQWTPLLQVGRVWMPSVLLCGVAGLLFARRMGWTGSTAWQRTSGLPLGLRAACSIRVPGILIAIAVLNGLHEAWVARWDRSWPWLLITVGVLLLIERMALRQAASLNAPVDPTLNGGL